MPSVPATPWVMVSGHNHGELGGADDRQSPSWTLQTSVMCTEEAATPLRQLDRGASAC